MEVNRGICPICGKPNNCAFEKGKIHEGCWCEKISVPKELMQKVPKEFIGKACICKDCVMEFIKSN
ncbi:MAG: hypothetical protein E7213_11535 [Clostridium sp.]|nr:hypothetical protein [Clostridium sp.]